MIEKPDWELSEIESYLNSDEFYKRIIRYRMMEYFKEEMPTKKELLKLLSLWEMDL